MIRNQIGETPIEDRLTDEELVELQKARKADEEMRSAVEGAGIIPSGEYELNVPNTELYFSSMDRQKFFIFDKGDEVFCIYKEDDGDWVIQTSDDSRIVISVLQAEKIAIRREAL